MGADARDAQQAVSGISRTDGRPQLPPDASRVAALLQDARAAHGRGDFVAAGRGYLALLAHDPEHAEALHLLGALRFQQGQTQEAETLIRHSIERKPSALSLANHASVLATMGRGEEALSRLNDALEINPAFVRALLQRADVLTGLQRHDEALAAYDRLLETAPALVEGLCGRGAALRTLGRLTDALASCDSALNVDGKSFDAWRQRGHVLRDLGRHHDALESYARALEIVPHSAELLFVHAMTLADLGHLQQALAGFNDALAAWPDFADALYNSAVVLERLQRCDEAIARCDRLLAIDPRHAKAHANRGNALQGVGRDGEAVASYNAALELAPDSTEVRCNLARALRHLDRLDEALQAAEEALELDRDCAPAWFARGRALQGLHRNDDALASFERVLRMAPAHKQAHFQRGNVLTTLRQHAQADDAYAHAIALDPDYVWAHCLRAFLCLSTGDFRTGWEEYEWRWRDAQLSIHRRPFAQPQWRGGEPLAGKTILLHAEQGLGDTLQFCRYVPLVKARGATVILEVPSALKSLLATLPGFDRIVAFGDSLPPFDLHCPLLSLPLAFGTDLSTIPHHAPYLRADPAKVEAWRARLGPRTRPRIGLVWSGNPKHLNDRNRSIALASLLPLITDAFEWVSLQKVVREDDAPVLAASRIVDPGDAIADFADTAALVETMDCVLSVDTSVAHLAGALGRPLWIMLPHTPDWRWQLERDDSPWYPGARLFRQTVPGDWHAVFEQLRAALPSLMPAAAHALHAPHA